MRSSVPKVLHHLCGQEMLLYPIQAARQAGIERVVVVVGHGAEQVKALLGEKAEYVQQSVPQGTGHAVLQASPVLKEQLDHLLVLSGDAPLVLPGSLARLMERHQTSGAALTFLTAPERPCDGLGRVLRDLDGRPLAIVEEAEATPDVKAVGEVNAGVYCFASAWLWPQLEKLKRHESGELYLVDLVALAAHSDVPVQTVACEQSVEALGVNDRLQLAQAGAVLHERVRNHWMLEGVTILDPWSTYIDAQVEIGKDTVLHPNTMLYGSTSIGPRCAIGPNTLIRNSAVGPDCKVLASVVDESILEGQVDVGPFSHVRPESYLEAEVHLGNFVEVKKSRMGKGTKSGHVSYIGDATIGRSVNIGAGSITCNFDGVNKNPSYIEDNVFIGCDTMLVAPVRVGARATTGAGAVVTKDVPPDSVVVGIPAHAIERSGERSSKGSPPPQSTNR